MDFPFLVLTIIAALSLNRPRALAVTLGLWTVAVAMVGWGPAHSDGVDTATLGFWGPWFAVLAIGLLLVFAIHAVRGWRQARTARATEG